MPDRQGNAIGLLCTDHDLGSVHPVLFLSLPKMVNSTYAFKGSKHVLWQVAQQILLRQSQ